MHTRDDGAFVIKEVLFDLIKQVDVYVGEMDLNETPVIPISSFDMLEHIRSHQFLRTQRQIKKSFGIDIAMYRSVHPMLIIGALSERILKSQQSLLLDDLLWQYAAMNEKQVVGLESAQEQMNILHALPIETAYKQIVEIGTSPGKFRRHTLSTFRVYQKQDIRLLYHLAKSGLHKMRRVLLSQRNIEMVKRIEEFEKDKLYFISVGAGHLWGKQGILALLKRNNWIVKPVRII